MKIGISTCPNDTYTFCGLLESAIADAPALDFTLEDIQALNDHAMAGDYDIAKVSFHAALKLADEYRVLPVGAALGYGVGPLKLARDPSLGSKPKQGDIVLCPGQWTTATLLYRLLVPDGPEPEHVVFSQIMPALQEGRADFGVVIHEGRFTYEEYGLSLAMDLGHEWETQLHQPLPLGGLVIRRSLGEDVAMQVTQAVRQSMDFAMANPNVATRVMSRYAQEFSNDVLWEHVKLYVNETTYDLGQVGREALEALATQARKVGLIDSDVSLF
ncbi:MAG: 1,4-dihydroxy-6-naphthoate synthase [Phycisphaeraceae bacterium JB051]